MKSDGKIVIAVLGLVVIAGAFWILLLSPKRQEAQDLAVRVERLESSLAQHESEVAQALADKREFPTNYSQLVVLGKAAPADSETPSLLVQVQHIARHAGVRFETITLASAGSGGEASAATPVPSGAEPVSPTEVAASTTPLGASIGPAGLSVMPYTLTFTGGFFQVAGFIRGLDNLVKTTASRVSVDGRLFTINSFSLAPAQDGGFPQLQATFSVTTFLTPPEQGLTFAASSPAAAPTTSGTPAAEITPEGAR